MKNLIYLLVIILFFGCASKKTVQKSNTEQKIEQQNDITDTKASQVETKKTSVDNSCTDDETVTKTTKYDTSKPNEPGTGKPPIVEETTTTHTKHKKSDVKTNVDIAKEDKSLHKDNSKINNDSKSNTVAKETPKTPEIAYWFYIGIFITICIGAIFLRKYWSKIKAFFDLLFHKV